MSSRALCPGPIARHGRGGQDVWMLRKSLPSECMDEWVPGTLGTSPRAGKPRDDICGSGWLCHHPTPGVILGLGPRTHRPAGVAVLMCEWGCNTRPSECVEEWVLGTSPRMTSMGVAALSSPHPRCNPGLYARDPSRRRGGGCDEWAGCAKRTLPDVRMNGSRGPSEQVRGQASPGMTQKLGDKPRGDTEGGVTLSTIPLQRA